MKREMINRPKQLKLLSIASQEAVKAVRMIYDASDPVKQ
jgi:hypothetical protein